MFEVYMPLHHDPALTKGCTPDLRRMEAPQQWVVSTARIGLVSNSISSPIGKTSRHGLMTASFGYMSLCVRGWYGSLMYCQQVGENSHRGVST